MHMLHQALAALNKWEIFADRPGLPPRQWWLALGLIQGLLLLLSDLVTENHILVYELPQALRFLDGIFYDPLRQSIQEQALMLSLWFLPLLYFCAPYYNRMRLYAAWGAYYVFYLICFSFADRSVVTIPLYFILYSWLALPFLPLLFGQRGFVWFEKLLQNSAYLVLTWAFVGIAYILIWLSYELFRAVGLDPDWLFDPLRWFVGSAAAVLSARVLIADRDQFFGKCLALLQLFSKLLLLPVGILCLVFLPFALFGNLHDMGRADYPAAVLLGIMAVVALLTNLALTQGGLTAVDEKTKTLFRWAIIVQPVFAALAAYALFLRIQQYGFSAERIFASYVMALAVFIACANTFILWRTTLDRISTDRVNRMAAILFSLAFLSAINPWTNLYALSAWHQKHRLLNGADVQKFDFHYLRYSLGKYGEEALRELAAIPDDRHKNAAAIRANAMIVQGKNVLDIESLLLDKERVEFFSKNPDLKLSAEDLERVGCRHFLNSNQSGFCWIIAENLDDDAEYEFLVHRSYEACDDYIVINPNFSWIDQGVHHEQYYKTKNYELRDSLTYVGKCTDLREKLRKKSWQAVMPKKTYKDFLLDERRFTPY